MRRLAIIPARGGSKGLIDKNIKIMNGKPMIAYSIEAALRSNLFDEVMVSTDSIKYAQIASEYGASVPFLRSSIASSDVASSWDVALEIINKYQDLGQKFDTAVLLQPTSPLRNHEDIVKALEINDDLSADAVVSVTQADHPPLWYNTLPDDYSLKNFIKKEVVGKPRQDLPVYYRINGAIYCFKVEKFLETKDVYQSRCFAYIMPKERSIDIDDEVDFVCAEALMKVSGR
ncbi:MAG: neuA [Clostridia bacterium]|jgi:CMP-N,N'-diacetyllegionaminic acid synthase|nr:neuA [Clostridia bacterium]